MRYLISKAFSFSASHQLLSLPPEHPCSRLHGHNYTIILTLGADTLDERGFVVDYRDLNTFKQFLDSKLDHRHLNDVFPAINPTAENLARILYAEAAGLGFPVASVTVKETEKTAAEYKP